MDKKTYQAEYYKKNKKVLKKYKREYYRVHQKELREYGRKAKQIYLSDPVNRIRFLIYGASKRALTKNLKRDIMGLATKFLVSPPRKCSCCFARLNYQTGQGRTKRAPSLDRLDSHKGYTVRNTFVVCDRCNWVKNNGTAEEHQIIAKYMTTKGKYARK